MSASSQDAMIADEGAFISEEPIRGQFTIFWQRFRRHKVAVVSCIYLIFIVLIAVFAPLIAPYPPNEINLELARFGEPAAPSLAHPMGSDQVGRDILSRIIFGARVSLVVGFLATGLAILVGTLAGAVSGFIGGWVDMGVMRFADIMLAFPPLLFAMAALAAFDNKTQWHIAIVLGVIAWMNVARLVRGEFLVLRTREYTEAARAIGASNTSIIFRELLPNAVGPIIVAASLGIPAAILVEATLSFLGFGIQPPTASWGNMVSDAFDYMRDFNAWWMGVFPGLMLASTVLAFNFFGDGLRDALDPRSRRE